MRDNDDGDRVRRPPGTSRQRSTCRPRAGCARGIGSHRSRPRLDGERASAPSCPASPEPSSTAAALSQLSIEVRLAGNGDLADEVLDLARALEASEPASDTLVTAAQLVPEALSVLRELTAPECLAEYEPALARLAGSTEALVPPAEAAPSLRDLLINGYGMAADDAACVDRGLTESRVTPDLADEVIVLAALSRCANEGGGA